MEFDIKNNLLKASVGENRLGQKNIRAAIDDSMVTQMSQKGLDMNLEKDPSFLKKKDDEKEKEKNKKKNLAAAGKPQSQQESDAKKIVRDPLVLLKLL